MGSGGGDVPKPDSKAMATLAQAPPHALLTPQSWGCWCDRTQCSLGDTEQARPWGPAHPMPHLGRQAQAPTKAPQGGYGGEGRGGTEGTVSPRSLVSPSFTCLEPPNLANLTLEDASECLMQH